MSQHSHVGVGRGGRADVRYIDDLEATVKAPGFKHADFWERAFATDRRMESTDDRLPKGRFDCCPDHAGGSPRSIGGV